MPGIVFKRHLISETYMVLSLSRSIFLIGSYASHLSGDLADSSLLVSHRRAYDKFVEDNMEMCVFISRLNMII